MHFLHRKLTKKARKEKGLSSKGVVTSKKCKKTGKKLVCCAEYIGRASSCREGIMSALLHHEDWWTTSQTNTVLPGGIWKGGIVVSHPRDGLLTASMNS